jgi:quercetin dioxygenase-like cupin family protein
MVNAQRILLHCGSAVAITWAVSGTAFAQGATTTPKVVAENSKLQVLDNVSRPGDVSPMQSRDGLVAYYVSGGTTERTYADGKKEVIERKTGEALIVSEKRPYSLKNVGKTTMHIITVKLK